MAKKIRKKRYIEANVYEKALERIEYLYANFDDVVVSFSGGKDSTALLLCCIDVATKLGRLPVRAVFYDEEAIHPTTIEYVDRVRQDPRVALEWYCIPIKHRNACSNESPFWYCWDPDKRDLWVRDMPAHAITTHPVFQMGMSMQEFGIEQFRRTGVVCVQGIRTEESIRRYRAVAMKQDENFIAKPAPATFFAYPIYDMSSKDVWKLVQMKDADYNRTYDIFNRTEMHEHFLTQRVCPPYGEEPLRGLWVYAECFPELWHKMIARVPGAATAARYGNTELYSSGFKPDEVSWRQQVQSVLDQYDGDARAAVAAALNAAITRHNRLTADPIPEDQPHLLSGASWKFLSKLVTRGDFKGRIIGTLDKEAQKAQMAAGITQQQAQALHGRKAKRKVKA